MYSNIPVGGILCRFLWPLRQVLPPFFLLAHAFAAGVAGFPERQQGGVQRQPGRQPALFRRRVRRRFHGHGRHRHCPGYVVRRKPDPAEQGGGAVLLIFGLQMTQGGGRFLFCSASWEYLSAPGRAERAIFSSV